MCRPHGPFTHVRNVRDVIQRAVRLTEDSRVMTASGVTSSNGGTSLCGISTARIPARFAPCTSEKGRSPTKTQLAGSSMSSARITARKASG